MKRFNFGVLGMVFGGLLLLGTSAQAEMITVEYVTIGTFTGGQQAGSNVYADDGVVIRFDEALNESVTVPVGVTSQVTFGTFDSTGTTASDFTSVNSGFILDIFQISPSEGQTQFVGTLTGRLFATASQAFVQFDEPLVSQIGLVIYEIASADRNLAGVPTFGRVNISPPTANQGRSTIAGFVTPIPEPSALVLVGLGAVAPLGLALRRRMKARAAA